MIIDWELPTTTIAISKRGNKRGRLEKEKFLALVEEINSLATIPKKAS